MFFFCITRFIYLSTSSIHVSLFKFLFIPFFSRIALRLTDELYFLPFLIASCDQFHSIFLFLFYVAYACFFMVILALPMMSKRKLNLARESFDLNLERKNTVIYFTIPFSMFYFFIFEFIIKFIVSRILFCIVFLFLFVS